MINFKFVFQKKSILVTTLLLFWAGYVGTGIVQYIIQMNKIVAQDNKDRFNRIDYEMYLAAPLLATGETEVLRENLDEAAKARGFDFYVLKDNDKLISFYNPGHTAKDMESWIFEKGKWLSDDQRLAWRNIEVRGFELIVGIQMRGSEFVIAVAKQIRLQLAIDLLMTTALIWALVYFVMKDILDLTRVMQSKSRDQSQLVKVRTKEAEVLLAVTSEYEHASKSLKLSNKSYAESLSPAVRYELNEGTPVPHLFDAVVVRIDVNGYTQMFLEKKDEFVTTTLNQYFQRAAEIIQRYNGHIYQYVGDEIVFHFKAEDHDQPMLSAISCVRSLFEVAEDMDEELKPKGVPFVVKGSIARGRLRFIRLDTGYAFAGLPLIESVRMLGKIEERQNNIVALYAEDFEGFEYLAEPFKKMAVEFKGFGKQSEIVEIKEFKNINLALESGLYKGLSAWRSDRDLVLVIQHLRTHMTELNKERFLALYKVLREFDVERTNGQVVEEYKQLLFAANEFAEKESYDEQTAFAPRSSAQEMAALILASVINLGAQLLRAGVFNDEVRLHLEKNLTHADQRIRGNAILALDELAPESYSFREMFSLPFNRAAADALIAEGRREYTAEVHRFLKSFLQSDDPFFVASGLYVLAYLYDYHRVRDSVYFAANSEMQEIPALIKSVRGHRDVMVQRRLVMSENLVSNQKAS